MVSSSSERSERWGRSPGGREGAVPNNKDSSSASQYVFSKNAATVAAGPWSASTTSVLVPAADGYIPAVCCLLGL